MTDLIKGEASESDEEPIQKSPTTKQMLFTATEMPGEATESDEDIFEHPAQAENDLKIKDLTRTNSETQMDSLLKIKLMQNNERTWRNYNAFIKTTCGNASKELMAADQLLMKSQLTMQSVLMSFKTSEKNLRQLHIALSNVCTADFLPTLPPWNFELKRKNAD